MKVFDFEHVQLLPKRCIVESRNNCNTVQKLGNFEFKIPIVPANMKTIIDEELAIEMGKKGYFYIMHRFDVDNLNFIKRCQEQKIVSSISIGVKNNNFEEVTEMKRQNLIPDFITIDIAHGHSESVRNIISHVREELGQKVFIIAGNVATPEAVTDLERWGADATKVGVGPGKVCITRLKTGFGTAGWQLSAIKWCSKAATKPIIADGGIRYHGDIAKALRFGASLVMVGSILSGHLESPGQTIEIDGHFFKEYYGSASEFNKGEKRYVEGKKELVSIKGSLWETFIEIEQDLQSAISYAGGKNLTALRHVNYVLLKNTEGY